MLVELAVARKCSQRVMSTEQSIASAYADIIYSMVRISLISMC